jgi:S-adenosylmethionine:tRNA ribosyltransferase-isomerase
LLVANNTRVLPAKLLLRRKTGASVPGLFLKELSLGVWEVMLRSRGKVAAGDALAPAGGGESFTFHVDKRVPGKTGVWQVTVSPAQEAARVLSTLGAMPIPPYIEKARRQAHAEDLAASDERWYRTVFAAATGHSVAAPTAGLHFTPEVIARLGQAGVQQAYVSLDVGPGTFLPVETETLEAHPMHTEHFSIPGETIAAVRAARAEGRRIVAVGTTSVRALEAAAPLLDELANPLAENAGISMDTALKIMPGFEFRLTDALITNFHLPKSTLLALVAALLGMERVRELYAIAVAEGYRFYSYGDAMLILP